MSSFADLVAPVLAFAAGLPAITLAALLWFRTRDRSFELLATGLGLQAILAFILSVGIFLAAARLVANPELRFVLWNTTFLISFGCHLLLRRFAALVIPGPGVSRNFPRFFTLASGLVYIFFLSAAFAVEPPAIDFSGRLVYALSAIWYFIGYIGPARRLWAARAKLPSWMGRLFARAPLAIGLPLLGLGLYEALRLFGLLGRDWPSLGPLAVVAFFALVTIELFHPLAKAGETDASQSSHGSSAGEPGTLSSSGPEERAHRIAARCAADPLTRRELEILALLLEGWRNQDIAKRLGLSQNTVKNHVYNLYQKTGVANRVELARLGD
ncbi:MAG TPA: helix-turn-helix transcriptional regulator [Rectinemataceae bacterium]|nr:helix-turn-helix transcriptional regulator [Rectinemataceae bacterium]